MKALRGSCCRALQNSNTGGQSLSSQRDLRKELPNYNANCGPSLGSMRGGRFAKMSRGSCARLLRNSNTGGHPTGSQRDLHRKLPNYNASCMPSLGSMREGRFVKVFRGSRRGPLQNSNSGRQPISNTRDLHRMLPSYYARCVPSMGSMRDCLLYTSPSPRDRTRSRMPSSA